MPDYIFNNPKLKQRRKELRNNSTPAEIELWKKLKNKALCGRKFRRQYSVGKYILDFYCPEERLGIELDGSLHFDSEKSEYDKIRTEIINKLNIKILRFENYLIIEDINKVLEEIESNLKIPPLAPPKLGGE
jgi:very-short-patch-repair endonuclease